MASPNNERPVPVGNRPLEDCSSGDECLPIAEPCPSRQPKIAADIIAATDRAEDLLALWREYHRLGHGARLARLRFELIEIDPDEQDELANEVANWKLLIRAYAEATG